MVQPALLVLMVQPAQPDRQVRPALLALMDRLALPVLLVVRPVQQGRLDLLVLLAQPVLLVQPERLG